jgi:hypothetical protein
MAKSIYPDDVWLAIKTLWESVPKISWAEVLRQVSESMSCEVPSQQACINRQNKEKWKKKRLKRDLKNDLKNDPKNQVSSDDKNQLKTVNYDDFVKQKIAEKMLEKSDGKDPLNVADIIQAVQAADSEQMRVVRRHRSRADLMGDLQDTLMAEADDVFSLKLNIQDANFDEDSKKQSKMLSILDRKANIMLTLMLANKHGQDIQFKAWGITEIESEESAQARKQDYQTMEDELTEQRLAVKDQQEQLFIERTRMIEQGYWLERTQDEVDADIEADVDDGMEE